MGVDLKWEGEFGDIIEEIHDPKKDFVRLLRKSDISETHCLQYIDFYGDTVFNRMQIPIFINELEKILKGCEDIESRNIGMKILNIAKKSLDSVHTYLKFYGD